MARRFSLGLLPLLAVAGAPGPVRAQSFAGGPVGTLVMPAGDAAPAPADRPREATDEGAPRAALRPLPAHPNGTRLSGEVAFLEWPLGVTAAQARVGGTFRVAFTTAVSVLPGTSTLALAVNDAAVGQVPLGIPGRPQTATFTVGPGLLVPGLNAVRLAVAQRHRVDCAPEATHELWTQIDPDGTGFLPARGTPSDPAALPELRAARLDADGTLPVRVVLGQARLTPATTDRALRAVQALALAAPGAPLRVDFGPVTEGAGLALALGSHADLAAALGPLPDGVAEGHAAMLPGGEARRPTITVVGRTEAELDAGVAELAALSRAPASGSPAGMRANANFPGRAVTGGERVALSAFGLPSAEFAGRVLRVRLNLALPRDFVPADYDKVTLDFAGAYAAGLDPRAQVAVEVNGGDAGSIGLARASGDAFRHNRMFLPLSRLRPGLNRLAITAILPRAGEGLCPERPADGADEAKRLLLLDSTEIVIPPLARAVRLPDLLHAAPPAGDGAPVALAVPAPDRAAMAAAATLAARLAVAQGRILPFAFTTVAAGAGPRLVVGPAPVLDPALLRTAHLDPEALRAAWSVRTPAPATNREAERRRRLARDGIGACAGSGARPAPRPDAAPAGEIDPDLLARWSLDGRRSVVGVVRDALAGLAADAQARLGALLTPAPAAANDRAALAGAALALGQGLSGPDAQGPVTIVTAADAAGLAEGVHCLTDPRVWDEVRGPVALLSGGTVSLPAVAVDEHWSGLAQAGSGNARRVIAAWLSLHPFGYGALALAAALVLALATHRLVRSLGRSAR